MPDLIISFSQNPKLAFEFSSFLNLPLVVLKQEEDLQKIEKGKKLLVLDLEEDEKELKKALSFLCKTEPENGFILSLFKK